MSIYDILYISGSVLASLGGGALIVYASASRLATIWMDRYAREHASKLDQLSYEHNIRFSSIHAKQAELIAHLYSSILDLRKELGALWFCAGDDTIEGGAERGWEVQTKANDVRASFERNRIYFSTELNSRITEIMEIFSKSAIYHLGSIHESDPDLRTRKLKEARDYISNAEKKIDLAIEQMEHDFRLLLGVK